MTMQKTMRVRSADLSVDDPELRRQLMAAVSRVFDHGMMLLGPEVDAFEQRFAEFCAMPYGVAVASGTSAVYLALKALGIGAGDEVITTPMSWIASLNAVHQCGASPVFVDVGDDLNMDADLIEAAITPRSKAVLVVHYTGRLCDMPRIKAIARRHGLLVIEDASQAYGARMDGRVAGGWGDAAGFSLNPMKVLHGYGEAGMVTLRREEARDRVVSLRYLGTINKETCVEVELNHKPDALQAALLCVSMDWFEGWGLKRHANALRYAQRLSGLVGCPVVPDRQDWRSVYFDFTVVAERRDALLRHLQTRGVEAKIKHPLLMPDQPAYAHLPRPRVPRAHHLVHRIITLPVHEKLTEDQIDYVSDCIEEFYRG